MRRLGGLGALYGTGWVVMVLLPSWGWALALDTARAFEPGSWHTLLTYAVVHPSLVYLVGMLLLSALALLILVQHMRTWQVILMGLAAALAAALLRPRQGGGSLEPAIQG